MFLLKCAAPPPNPWIINIGVAPEGLQCMRKIMACKLRVVEYGMLCMAYWTVFQS
jgi:hypothetical protein